MKKPTLAAAATTVLLIFTSAAQPAQAGRDDDAEMIKQLNREIIEALMLENDPAPLQKAALDQYLVIAPGGRVETKAQAVAGADALDVAGMEISNEQVIFQGDAAVIVGKLDIDGAMQPMGKLPPMKFMATLVKTDGEWRALSRSMTPCAPVAVERGVC